MGIERHLAIVVVALAGLWFVDRSVVAAAWLFDTLGMHVPAVMTGPLDRASRSWVTPLRRLAAWELDVAQGDGACAAMERRISDATDPWVWGLAVEHTSRHHPKVELRPRLEGKQALAEAAAGASNPHARVGALLALELLGDGLTVCAGALSDAEPSVRTQAARCVLRLDAQGAATAPLVAALRAERQGSVVVALVEALASRDGAEVADAVGRAAEGEAQALELAARGGQPWARELVLRHARGSGPQRDDAFDALVWLPWGEDIAEVCRGTLLTPLPPRVGPALERELSGCRRAVAQGLGLGEDSMAAVKAALGG